MERTRPRIVKDIEEFNERPFRPVTLSIGKNVKIHPSATFGGDGFTWARRDDGSFVIAQNLGDIIIEDDVRIGEQCTIRRSTLPEASTVIGKGSVLIGHVNVGHNCKIGKNTFIGPHVCLNGSVKIGDQCWIAAHAVIHQQVKIGDGAVVGLGAVVLHDVPPGVTVVGAPAVPIEFVGSFVHPSFTYGQNLQFGKFNHIHEDVTVGYKCTIRSHVELRAGTLFGNRCYIDSGVKSSGDCVIGDDVVLRYDDILAKGVRIASNVFISPGLNTENLDHRGKPIGGAYIGTGIWNRKTKYRVFIGTDVTLKAGIKICSGTTIGSDANVRKSITEPGIYFGNPARKYEG